MNHLEYYKECLETGLLKGENLSYLAMLPHRNGLCYEPDIDKDLLTMFTPTVDDCIKYNVKDDNYWAADKEIDSGEDFGPTRQNIVLFIAAMKGEL